MLLPGAEGVHFLTQKLGDECIQVAFEKFQSGGVGKFREDDIPHVPHQVDRLVILLAVLLVGSHQTAAAGKYGSPGCVVADSVQDAVHFIESTLMAGKNFQQHEPRPGGPRPRIGSKENIGGAESMMA